MKNLVEELYPKQGILYMNEICNLLGRHYSTIRRWRKEDPDFPPTIWMDERSLGFRKDLVIKYLEKKEKGRKK